MMSLSYIPSEGKSFLRSILSLSLSVMPSKRTSLTRTLRCARFVAGVRFSGAPGPVLPATSAASASNASLFATAFSYPCFMMSLMLASSNESIE